MRCSQNFFTLNRFIENYLNHGDDDSIAEQLINIKNMKGKPVCVTRFDESGKVVYQSNDLLNKSESVKESHVSPAKSIEKTKDFVFFTKCFGKKVYLTLEEALQMKDSCIIEKEYK